MGVFDTFHDRDGKIAVQLKAGHQLYEEFTEGNRADGYEDGVYHGFEGVVVIRDGMVSVVRETTPENLPEDLPHFTKWGGLYHPDADPSGLAK